MTLRASPNVAFVMISGRALKGLTERLSDLDEVVVEQIDGAGEDTDRWASVEETLGEIVFEGWYDTGAGLTWEALKLTGKQIFMMAIEGNVIGDDFMGMESLRSTFDKLMAKGTFHKVKGTFKSDQGPDRGVVLAPLATRTDVGPTSLTPYDWGAAYANQVTGSARAYIGLSALNLDGGTGLTVKVRDSEDNIVYADLIAFTALVAAPGSERKYLAAAAIPNDIERYTLVQYEFTGAPGANRSATFAVGLARPLT